MNQEKAFYFRFTYAKMQGSHKKKGGPQSPENKKKNNVFFNINDY